MEENIYNKKIGIGSLSSIISIFALLFSCYNTGKGTLLAEHIVGPTIPYGIISLILWGYAIYLGEKYSNHKWAKLGFKLSIVFITLWAVGILLTLLLTLIKI